MADISKCEGKDCPLKASCYRFTAKPSLLAQSYVLFVYNRIKGECEGYWSNQRKEFNLKLTK